jgi:hypothetical protein
MFWGLWAPILLGLGSWHKYHVLKRLKEKADAEKAADEVVYSDMEDSES